MTATEYAPSDRRELTQLVRALTGYDDTSDQLPQSQLEQLIQVAQLRLANKAGDDFYTDAGLGQALLGYAAILAKAEVENYSVSGYTIGATTVDTSGAGKDDAAQMNRWATLVTEGLDASTAYDAGGGLRDSAGYIGREARRER
jgi:hypothetical protein